MNRKKIILYMFASILITGAINIYTTPDVKANGTIPTLYSQTLGINSTYTYNVTEFDSKFTWSDLNYAPRGDAITNPGGVINVSIVHFYDEPAGVAFPSCFDDPIPHINISFYENITNNLVLNTTFTNVSNSEAGLSLALNIKAFYSGFVIQAGNLATVKVKAQEQALTWTGSVTITDYDSMLNFTAKKSDDSQNGTMLYDKATGILVYSSVQNQYGPDLEINMTSYNFDYTITPSTDPPDNPLIPGFPSIVVISIIGTISVIWILKKKNKIK